MENTTPLTETFFYILLAVHKPNHGYGIIGEVAEMTGNRVNLGPGTLYGAINSMLDKGWISLYSEDKVSRKKKEYLITELGEKVFAAEVERLKELLENADRINENSKAEKTKNAEHRKNGWEERSC